VNVEYFQPIPPREFEKWTEKPSTTLQLTSVLTGKEVTLSNPEGICTDGSVQSCFARHEGQRVRVTNGRVGVTFVSEQIAWQDHM